jgi:hypothetical protein
MIATLVRRLIGRKPPPEFRHEELVGLFTAMKDANISTETTKRFAKRLARPNGGPLKGGYGLLRFDIHGNIERPLRVAKELKALEMHGLFLTMHRHPVNDAIYDAPATWDALRQIAEMDHEVGLHFDPFYLIRAHGDLYAGIGAAVAELKERGVKVQTASVHGDTRAHIKACGLQANDFFAEGYRQTKWNGQAPEGETFLAEHVKRYSQAKIAEDHGIRFFVEANFSHMGQLVGEDSPAYLSDNRRQLRVNNLPDEQGNNMLLLAAPEPLRITPEFAREVATALKTRPFLALFHPQWYA